MCLKDKKTCVFIIQGKVTLLFVWSELSPDDDSTRAPGCCLGLAKHIQRQLSPKIRTALLQRVTPASVQALSRVIHKLRVQIRS